MKKEYSDSVKLKFLKQYTENEAHDLVKNYYHPQDVRRAIGILRTNSVKLEVTN